MRDIFRAIRDFCKKADMVLLALCVAASGGEPDDG